MDLATRKYRFIQSIEEIDEEILKKLEQVLKANSKSSDWMDNLTEDEIKEIEIGLEQAENNDTSDHNQIMKKFEKWR